MVAHFLNQHQSHYEIDVFILLVAEMMLAGYLEPRQRLTTHCLASRVKPGISRWLFVGHIFGDNRLYFTVLRQILRRAEVRCSREQFGGA